MTNTRARTASESSPRPGSVASRLEASTTVLVVEDEPDIALLLGAYFRASGIALEHVNPRGVEDVIDGAVTHAVDVIVLDLFLVGLTGFDVLTALRGDTRVADTPVVVVTADHTAEDRVRQLGATDFVPKPFNVKDLFARVMATVQSAEPNEPDAPSDPDEPVEDDDIVGAIDDALADGPCTLALVTVSAGLQVDVAAALARALPDADVLGAGGDIALLIPVGDAVDAGALLMIALEDTPGAVRAGVASFPEHASSGDELYMAADAALADAAESGTRVALAR